MAEKEQEKGSFTIDDIDQGAVVEQLRAGFMKIAGDILERPDLIKPRTLTLVVSMTPTEHGFVNVVVKEPTIKLPANKASSGLCGMPDANGNFMALSVSKQGTLPIQQGGFATDDE